MALVSTLRSGDVLIVPDQSYTKGLWSDSRGESPEVGVLIHWARGGFAPCHQQCPCERIFRHGFKVDDNGKLCDDGGRTKVEKLVLY